MAGKTTGGIVALLDGGEGQVMGEGVVAITQEDERGDIHTVVVNRVDLEALLAAC